MLSKVICRRSLRVLTSFCLVVTGITVYAEESPSSGLLYSVGAGVYAHDIDLDWAHDSEEDGVNYNVELVLQRTSWALWGGKFHPNLGVSINDSGDTSFLYAGLLWSYPLAGNITFNSGINLVVHDGETTADIPGSKRLGSRVLFRIPIEIGYDFNQKNGVYLVFEHLSNASIENPNEGMDSLGVRYQYRF